MVENNIAVDIVSELPEAVLEERLWGLRRAFHQFWSQALAVFLCYPLLSHLFIVQVPKLPQGSPNSTHLRHLPPKFDNFNRLE